MGQTDQRVDAYIANSADFARPILRHLRKIIHAACPDVEETIKWQKPTFLYRGLLCGMAAFKQHCALGFWKYRLMDFSTNLPQVKETENMGQLGRITCLADLPADAVLMGYVKEAVRLNEQGIKAPRPAKIRKQSSPMPVELATALAKNKKARATFEDFSPSHQREYIEWIREAKREETRVKRLETTLAWLTEGKPRHWKYAPG